MCQFFDMEENAISKSEFIRLYADSYYLDKKRVVSGVRQSSHFIENEIDRLLKEGIKTKQDVAHVLAWKIGKIKHGESEEEFVYAGGWEHAEKLKAKQYGKPFELERLAAYIVGNLEKLEELSGSNPQEFLNDLREQRIKGVGTVYLLTLLYFLSRGKYPIYDRFARIAIDAIKTGKKSGEAVDYVAFPDKSQKKFETVMEKYMAPYIQNLEDVFGDSYHTDRDIDRALWVYGHAFNKEKGKIGHC